ncbi:MAG: amidase [Proteobacteria bacterium]|nr:amidase [Pseudomonadota bacterium]
MGSYDLTRLRLPVLSGPALRAFARLATSRVTGEPIIKQLLAAAGVPKLQGAQLDVPPTFMPLVRPREGERDMHEGASDASPASSVSDVLSARDFVRAYTEGRASPQEVAESLLQAIAADASASPPLRVMLAHDPQDLRAQARDAAARYRNGGARGPLDGVPVVIKDELHVAGYPTSVGTAFLGREPASQDATVVARLREAGALLVGKANMYEIGVSPESHNMHHGTVRNPYNRARQAGGSSSGPAAAVAAGLCPLAIGADGGGSIRVPAAMCGVVGLKATYGRFSEHGAAPLCWSLAHVGPIGATVQDVALAYRIAAGPDELDPTTLAQPPVALGHHADGDLRGVRLGVFRPWFEHAETEIVTRCDELVAGFEASGATVQVIEIPGLDLMRIAHGITILSEIAAAMQPHAGSFRSHAPAVQVNLALGRSFGARDYIRAQQVRTLAMRTFAAIFEQVDAVITPTTAVTAPVIRRGATPTGWSDMGSVTEIMRFVVPANLAGLPAISFPAGYTEAGLPIGMQAMARHWNEALLLRIACAAEQQVERRVPGDYQRLIQPSAALAAAGNIQLQSAALGAD